MSNLHFAPQKFKYFFDLVLNNIAPECLKTASICTALIIFRQVDPLKLTAVVFTLCIPEI